MVLLLSKYPKDYLCYIDIKLTRVLEPCMKLCESPAKALYEALHEALRRLCMKLCGGSV